MNIILNLKIYLIDGFCFFCDFESVVDAMANDPYDLVVGISQNWGGFLFESSKSIIVEEIGNELCAAHPEWTETVALLPSTSFQRKFKGIVI